MNFEKFTNAVLSKISEQTKWKRDFSVHIIGLYLSLPSRYNFMTIQPHGGKAESTYRANFENSHDMDAFNLQLIQDHLSTESIWAFAPSYLSKSGKHTPGVGYFWSGCAQKTKWGMKMAHLFWRFLLPSSVANIRRGTAIIRKRYTTLKCIYFDRSFTFYALLENKTHLKQLETINWKDHFGCP